MFLFISGNVKLHAACCCFVLGVCFFLFKICNSDFCFISKIMATNWEVWMRAWERARGNKEKTCFHQVADAGFDMGNWGSQKGESWKIPAVPLIFPSLLPSFAPSFPPVSSPSHCRITVSAGTGLTGRWRSKKSGALASASQMTYDTRADAYTNTRRRRSAGVGDDITRSTY